MKKYIIILSFITSFIISQDRSIIFNTGSPDDLTTGYIVSSSQSVANKFTPIAGPASIPYFQKIKGKNPNGTNNFPK